MERVVQFLTTANVNMSQERSDNKQREHEGNNKTIKASKARSNHGKQTGAVGITSRGNLTESQKENEVVLQVFMMVCEVELHQENC